MPQLDVETFPSLIFWLILSFGALYLGLHYWVLPKISKILGLREEKIETYLKNAQDFQKKSVDLQKENEEKLYAAHVEAQNLFIQQSQEMRDRFREKENEISEKFHKQYLEFEKDLTLKQQKISKALEEEASEFIFAFLNKITDKKISQEEIEKELFQMKKDKK